MECSGKIFLPERTTVTTNGRWHDYNSRNGEKVGRVSVVYPQDRIVEFLFEPRWFVGGRIGNFLWISQPTGEKPEESSKDETILRTKDSFECSFTVFKKERNYSARSDPARGSTCIALMESPKKKNLGFLSYGDAESKNEMWN